ncbi:hypothetical protein M4914_00795 [Streptomyces somaliensis DSM 40738]|uniref:Uncharacterized protein n=1 Tax=Streptomyces somaliensis (strain ATCC 33201 / DSM 40738 / JCM 12659 / KCTC 9044 / NCTC 11332 / NRRL B-12077 / IP 733) TaxID=1134445 RepID=A0AA44DHA9_STRE0|nr:hypothetical protein [Streptomyces somaliensis]MCQ0021655.1 hypothetical protein [Streptomyces somaliensis DSM 40738]NKY16639.1 hypothetical protein [Streptomyces somaliensis DSM 40738]
MYALRIECTASDRAAWERALGGDPLGRGAAGVRRYRVMRPVADPGRVLVDLDFDDLARAEEALARLRRLRARAAAAGPEAEVAEVVEVVEAVETGRYRPRPDRPRPDRPRPD